MQLDHAVLGSFALLVGVVQQVAGLGFATANVKMQEIVRLYHAAKANAIGTVYQRTAALLYLFKVAQAFIGLALANGKGAVCKVDEHFAALQVITANGPGGIALGCMRQHQNRQAVLVLYSLQFAH